MSTINRTWNCWSGEISAETATLSHPDGYRENVIEIYENVFGAVYIKDTPENRRAISMMADKGLGCNGVELDSEHHFGNIIINDTVRCNPKAHTWKQR